MPGGGTVFWLCTRGLVAAPCYKLSTIPRYAKEVLMRIPSSPRWATQFTLFQSSPRTPRWEQLPWEVRQQTVRLLARMLNEQAERRLGSPLNHSGYRKHAHSLNSSLRDHRFLRQNGHIDSVAGFSFSRSWWTG